MAYVLWNRVHDGPSRSSKVVDFGINRKRVSWNFLLVLNSNLSPILPCFRDIRQKPLFSYHTPMPVKILACSLWIRYVMLESAESEHPRLSDCEIIFEEFQPMWSRYLNVTDRRT